MSIRNLKPVTPSCRGTSFVSYGDLLWKGKPEKTLVKGAKSRAGRNNAGRITVRHQGGGHKQKYRFVDFKRSSFTGSAVVERVEYDPNRTAFIALIRSESEGKKAYIIAPNEIRRGDVVSFGSDSEIRSGSCMKLEDIPIGSSVHNVELKPGAGGQLARAGGVVARVVARDGAYTIIALPSGERRLILSACHATIGAVSNPDKKNISLGKAGRSRWLGVRPSVRGVAMNPVDHPLGGGEGKTSGGRHPVTPWGVCTKGKKTRKVNKSSSKYIMRNKRG